MNTSFHKYSAFPQVQKPDRRWPTKKIESAPIWCPVDLRDGNQALVDPMNIDEKLMMFDALVKMGYKEIEVGFPSASQVEFDMVRALIEQDRIPGDVTIQVLTQAREHLIRRTFEAVEGAKNVIIHLYVNISPIFRKVVFKTDLEGVQEIALKGARLIRQLAEERAGDGTVYHYEYSPEGFSATDVREALIVCDAIVEAYGATPDKKLILNLPSTVQMATPNVYADQIEYISDNLAKRDSVILSVHPHNDRGTGVADAELAVLAGAERVEGTMFGNGERTGNVDLVCLGLNLYTQGIDPRVDFSHLNDVKRIYERCTKMRVHERSPYAGELVFTAFAGSHQDAIKKGLDFLETHGGDMWEIPYLPLDPEDVGRQYEPIIRINSQSGKGGAAFILQSYYGYNLPKNMHPEFGAVTQFEADHNGAELTPEQVLRLFLREYCDVKQPYELIRHELRERGAGSLSTVTFEGVIVADGEEHVLMGEGNGPIDAFFSAMQKAHIEGFTFVSYHEHAISSGSDAKACAYIELKHKGRSTFGVGIESNINVASIKGVISAINRALLLDQAMRENDDGL